MNTKDFLNGTNLNSLNKKYEALELSSYEGPQISLKYTSFNQVDVAEGRRNNVSSIVQLQTQLIQCGRVHFEKSRRGYVTLYVEATANTSHGFGSKRQVLLIYKNQKGQKESIRLYRSWNREDFKSDLVGYTDLKLEKLNDKSYRVRSRYQRIVRNKLQDLLYSEMHDLERGRISEDLKNEYSKFGFTLVKAVPYTHEFDLFGIQFLKSKGLNFKIGKKNTSTYCSLPEVLELTVRKSPMKFIKLDSIGVETSGYYNHSEGLAIKPEDLKRVLQFKKQFQKECRGAK